MLAKLESLYLGLLARLFGEFDNRLPHDTAVSPDSSTPQMYPPAPSLPPTFGGSYQVDKSLLEYHPQWRGIYEAALSHKWRRYYHAYGRLPAQNWAFLNIAERLEREAASDATELVSLIIEGAQWLGGSAPLDERLPLPAPIRPARLSEDGRIILSD